MSMIQNAGLHDKANFNGLANIPLSYNDIVAEIRQFTGLTTSDIEHRVWMESQDPGWNVMRDVASFRVTPHFYNQNMIDLYRTGDGFIFETMVFWAVPYRIQWTLHALDRIRQYAGRNNRSLADLRILVFGDGCGNDSLFFANHSLNVDYYDVPGSKTFDFAMRRFAHYGSLDRSIHVLQEYSDCLREPYDVVISFEVLEHLPEPDKAISDIASMVKQGGIALVSEDFEEIIDRLPTHLLTNKKFIGQLPFLFLKRNMRITWYNREYLFKPVEFTKVEQVKKTDFLGLLKDPMIRGTVISRYLKPFLRRIEKASYLGGSRERSAG